MWTTTKLDYSTLKDKTGFSSQLWHTQHKYLSNDGNKYHMKTTHLFEPKLLKQSTYYNMTKNTELV